ncbi:Cell division protein FtsL [subsurface metagenome]
MVDIRADILTVKSNRRRKSYLVEQERVNTRKSFMSLSFFITSVILIGIFAFSIILLNFIATQNQLMIDEIKREIQFQDEAKEGLNFKIAQLQSPDIIYESAINLGMYSPDEIRYINLNIAQLAEKELPIEEIQNEELEISEFETFLNSKFKEDLYRTILTLLFP